jgi:predicted DNA-binding transcriptional regulator YafY
VSAPSAARVLALLVAARRRGGELTVKEAADLLGVGPVDLPVVLEGLEALGAPPFGPDDLVDLDLADGWLVVEAPAALAPPFPLTPLDAALLLCALRSLARGPGELAARLSTLADALADLLGPGLAGDLAGTFAWASPEGGDRALLDALAHAATAGHRLEVTFWNASRDRVEARAFLPEAVVQHTGAWYVVGTSPDGRRFLRLDRILSATTTGVGGPAIPCDADSLRVPWLYQPPAEPLRAEVRFERTRLPDAVERFAGAVRQAGRPDVLVLAAPTWPTLVRTLFEFGPGWEILAPAEPRALALRWAEQVGGGR